MSLEQRVAVLEAEVARLKSAEADDEDREAVCIGRVTQGRFVAFKIRGAQSRTVHLLPRQHDRVTPMVCGMRQPWRQGDIDPQRDKLCEDCLQLANPESLPLFMEVS